MQTAMLHAFAVQVLDEATSALDSASDSTVQAALDHVIAQGSCTVVVIAHRLATVQRCSNILVLDRGVIAERGSHAELLAANGAYAELAR
jgi:ABC-type multidrug transport system fused ATPase/permease subunit